MSHVPMVCARIMFLPVAEGGRIQLPDFTSNMRYMPHLVVQSPDVRRAIARGNHLIEDYLGVCIISGPPGYIAGQQGRFTLELMYWPYGNYDALQPGATFTAREGAHIIGYGTVLERKEPVGAQ